MISLSSPSAVTLLKQLMGSPPLQTTPRKLLISDPLTIQTSNEIAKMIAVDLFQEPTETKTLSQTATRFGKELR